MYWDTAYIFVLIGSIALNSAASWSLQKSHKTSIRKLLLYLGVILNLLVLCIFKYLPSIADAFLGLWGKSIFLEVELPLAISFFTFQQIAFLVDSYYKKIKYPPLSNYTLFVCFFPQLIAGPIVHYKDLQNQFHSLGKEAELNNVYTGIFLFSIGLFKKTVLADNFATFSNYGYSTPEPLSFYEAWATSLSYTFQLYFDFSGYSDMALGLALLFNIRLPQNFNSPYKALSIQDFWRRWHITLSNFLKDYVYIPLGGNRVTEKNIRINILITFLLAGIWHGAGSMFVVWGMLHGFAMITYRIWQRMGYKLPSWVAWITTFLFINFSWIFFRAETPEDAIKILKGMTNLGTISDHFSTRSTYQLMQTMNGAVLESDTQNLLNSPFLILLICLAFVIISSKNSNQLCQGEGLIKYENGAAGAFWSALLLFFSLISILQIKTSQNSFLYFQF